MSPASRVEPSVVMNTAQKPERKTGIDGWELKSTKRVDKQFSKKMMEEDDRDPTPVMTMPRGSRRAEQMDFNDIP